MGMYTEICFDSGLKKDIPQEVITALTWLTNIDLDEPNVLPEHEFFSCPRKHMIALCNSYYFDAATHSKFWFDDIPGSYYINIRASLKNYDNEIEKFIDWIMPYLNKVDGEFLGFYRYEESNEPTLIYYKTPE